MHKPNPLPAYRACNYEQRERAHPAGLGNALGCRGAAGKRSVLAPDGFAPIASGCHRAQRRPAPSMDAGPLV